MGPVVVVGAGPRALTLAVYLLRARPELHRELVVVDPAGTWLDTWDDQFARLCIPTLRSPGVHHPDPEPMAMHAQAHRHGVKLDPPFGIPPTAVFREFCQWLIDDLDLKAVLRRGRVVDVVPRADDPAAGSTVHFDDGTFVEAGVVVVTGCRRRDRMPDLAASPEPPIPSERMVASSGVDLRDANVAGCHVLVVGGGLTAAQLTVGVARKGGRATLVCRRPLRIQDFDTDPGWLGPRHLDAFWTTSDWDERARLIAAARDGGSIPASMRAELDDEGGASVRLCEGAEVCRLAWDGDAIEAELTTGIVLTADRVWTATGSEIDLDADPLLARFAARVPIRRGGTLPVLYDDLRWPGTSVFVMGPLAGLRLGPVAGNLSGARAGAARIAASLLGN